MEEAEGEIVAYLDDDAYPDQDWLTYLADSFLMSGVGHSVREVITFVERVTGRKARVTLQPRRPGDPAVLVANASRAKQALVWKARDSSMERVVETACAWYSCSRRIGEREALRPVLTCGAVAG